MCNFRSFVFSMSTSSPFCCSVDINEVRTHSIKASTSTNHIGSNIFEYPHNKSHESTNFISTISFSSIRQNKMNETDNNSKDFYNVHTIAWNSVDSWQDGRQFVVQVFGRQLNTSSTPIHIEIEGYLPSIRLKIPINSSRFEIQVFVNNLCKCIRGINPTFTFESKLPLYPYRDSHFRYIRLTFTGDYARKQTVDKIRQWIACKDYSVLIPSMELYDGRLPSLLMMQHELHVLPSGHISISKQDVFIDNNGIYHVRYDRIIPIASNETARFKISAFDIECQSYESFVKKSTIFPDAIKPRDTISQIGTCSWIVGTENIEKVIFVLDSDSCFFKKNESCINVEDFVMIPCFSERDLILNWARYIHDSNPDLITGYNITGFDWKYIHQRCLMLNIEDEFCSLLSRTTNFHRMYQCRELNSAAYGDNTMTFYNIPGRIGFDLYVHMKKEVKLDSYKLDDISKHFLKHEHKGDVTPYHIFQYMKESREGVTKVAKYCVQDCNLVVRLIQTLQIFPELMEMSNISKVPIDFIILRGQQIRCFSLITYHAMHNKYAVPDTIDIKNCNDYEGGFVLQPKKAVYMDYPVAVLDFMSLYPSLIIAYNLCYSTMIADIEPAKITSVEINPTKIHRFAEKEVREGLLSSIVQTLWNERQSIKKTMKSSPFYALLDARQKAIKVTMNSLYGMTAVSNTFAMLPCQPIAESITALGRQTILFAKSKMEEWYGGDVIRYIDSDSLFACFEGDTFQDIPRTFQIAFDAETRLNEILIPPIKMEMEQIFYPFIIMTKKRYCALSYEDSTDLTKTKEIFKGISIVRRDFCAHMKNILKQSLRKVFYERDIDEAHLYVQNEINKVLIGDVDDDSLVMSKSLSAKQLEHSNAINSKLPHVSLAMKMKMRDPNNAPRSGDRIQFLFVNNGKKLLCDKVEDPQYVKENALHIDYRYYLDHQIIHPIAEIFDTLLFPKKFDPYGLDVSNFRAFYKTQYNQASHEINERNRQTEITSFFGAKSVTMSPPSVSKFNAFAKRQREEKLKLVEEEKNEPELKRSPK